MKIKAEQASLAHMVKADEFVTAPMYVGVVKPFVKRRVAIKMRNNFIEMGLNDD